MSKKVYITIPVLIILALLLASCGGAISTSLPADAPVETALPEPTELPEYTWSQLLSRDSILPIYEPEFVPADEAGYRDDELVMGVAIEGEAKAYPVGPLNSREMVNDELAGIPILVTW